ncbi:hypothetical protein VTK26DRAFT_2022 [Humicola hyalothermophila]
MRAGEIAARALLGGMAMNPLEIQVTPNPAALLIRQSGCGIGEQPCATGCMPIGADCCAARLAYCDPGYYCLPVSGCCENGKTCSGVGGGSCDADEEPCNTGCMPRNQVCCPGGGYCRAGYTCTTDGRCRRDGSGSGSGGGDGGGGDSGGGCRTGESVCDSRFCIPSSGTCCNVGGGKYCRAGRYCVEGGCCRNGQTCIGSGSGSGSGGSDDTDEDTDDDDSIPTTRVRTTSTTSRSSSTGTSSSTSTSSSTRAAGNGGGGFGDGDDTDDDDNLPSLTLPPVQLPTFPGGPASGDGPPNTDAAGRMEQSVAGWVGVVVAGLMVMLL